MVASGDWSDMQVVAHTRRYCKVCGQETPHEWCIDSGTAIRVCVPCRERRHDYELDRE